MQTTAQQQHRQNEQDERIVQNEHKTNAIWAVV